MTSDGAGLARTLRERRRALGLTRTRLAERAGFSTSDVARWERGETVPGPAQIATLAGAVGLDDDETRALLDLAVDLTGPEVAVELDLSDDPPSDPFNRRIRPLRSDESLSDRVRSKLSGAASSGRARTPTTPPRLVAAPVVERELPSVFPDSPGEYDPSVLVYSTAPSTYPGPGDEQLYLLRRIRTAVVLIGLGLVLWWSVGALGEGLGDVLDLFRTPIDSGIIP